MSIGLALAILVPVVFILLTFSKIGLLVGILISLIYLILIALSIPLVLIVDSEFVRTKLFKDKLNSYISLLIITVLFYLITLIPYVGIIIIILAALKGSGKLVLCAINNTKKTK